MAVVNLLICLNSFFCGAIIMLFALCVQPEAVTFIRKVYNYDFFAHRKKHEEEEGRLYKEIVDLLDKRLNKLHDLTHGDNMMDDVAEAWESVDHSVDLLKNWL